MKNSIKILAQISLLVLLISCGTKENKSDSKEETHERLADVTVTQAQFKNEGMTLGSIKESSFPDWVEASGMIDVPPENRAVITAFMGGYIKNNPLLIGDAVKKGQVLITLENPEFVEIQQQFQELAEQLNYLKSEYERQQALVAENITSKKNFLKAESEYKRSVATYTGLRKKLQMLHINPERVLQGDYTSQASIYAPITGTIAETFVSKGSYVSSADPIMEIVDIDHIHLELEVFEKDMLKVKKGQKIQFTIPESSDQKYGIGFTKYDQIFPTIFKKSSKDKHCLFFLLNSSQALSSNSLLLKLPSWIFSMSFDEILSIPNKAKSLKVISLP